jgi:ribosome-associated protein
MARRPAKLVGRDGPGGKRKGKEDVRESSHQELARWCARKALEKKGEEVLLLDLREISTVCDFFILVTGQSEAHIWALAEWLRRQVRETFDLRPWHVEGRPGDRWILLDYVDWVIHIFHHETRVHYQLERLWGDAPRESFEP